ncbi:hypothetical protein BC827DRAFT_926849 [Russula dissimulans]|nr:hypothetical protein BC827DRAFT_926849 [Russula dissimulans]
MESFSWSDSLRALTEPCLGCLRSSQSERNDLEDLLADSGSGITADAETLSLHSNPGILRRKRTRFGKTIRLFGWDLFGRRPPIRLPDDDDDEEEEEEEDNLNAAYEAGEGREQGKQQQAGKKRSRRRPRPPPSATISTGALDSDAAPLDSAAIVSHATKHAEEEAERAARRAQRRERREAKRAALALAMERAAVLDADGEFEGFPGSGGRRGAGNRTRTGAVPPPLFVRGDGSATTGSSAGSGAGRGGKDGGEVGDEDEDEDEEGDFGADAYVRRSGVSSDSGRGSDSLSRTSTSVSGQQQQRSPPLPPLAAAAAVAHSGQAQPYNHHYISQQPSALSALRHSNSTSTKNKSSRSSASRMSSSSKRSRSSQSSSRLASPNVPQFSDALGPPAPTPTGLPRQAQEFEDLPSNSPRLHTAAIERLSSGFPSPGLGGPRNGKRDLGAFLANRGDA